MILDMPLPSITFEHSFEFSYRVRHYFQPVRMSSNILLWVRGKRSTNEMGLAQTVYKKIYCGSHVRKTVHATFAWIEGAAGLGLGYESKAGSL